MYQTVSKIVPAGSILKHVISYWMVYKTNTNITSQFHNFHNNRNHARKNEIRRINY